MLQKNLKKSIRIFNSKVADPFLNLAFEEWLLKDNPELTYSLFLYRNEKSVVLGRSQNPWTECNLTAMKKDRIDLVRRQSGGGCVYHDLGNSNYHITVPQPKFHRSTNANLVSEALNKLKVPTSVNTRNDIVFGEFKVSGSAFKISNGKAYHHGTMLINSDILGLKQYLNSKQENIETKGVASVRSKVINLQPLHPQLNHATFVETVIRQFQKYYECQDVKIEDLDLDSFHQNQKLMKYANTLKSWSWIYGQTPQFIKTSFHPQLPIELKLTVYNGKMLKFDLTSPYISNLDSIQSFVEKGFLGKLLDSSLHSVFKENENLEPEDWDLEQQEVFGWVLDQVKLLVVE